jgi:membrane-bound inhibitor of C-type lysozyme
VPSGSFRVEYINGGGNSLVVVPIGGNALVFSNVMAGSGARYTTQQYTGWEAKGSVALSSDSLTGKIQSTCHVVVRNERQ